MHIATTRPIGIALALLRALDVRAIPLYGLIGKVVFHGGIHMTSAEKKELATEFLSAFRDPDPAHLATMVSSDFVWKTMTRMEGFAPLKGHEGLRNLANTLKSLMPGGLRMRIESVICEGDRCAVQAESNAVASNGKKYNNLYHFDIRFDGDKIAEVREYCDTNHAREVFFAK
jgi:ketosteroid isomerase-like protein